MDAGLTERVLCLNKELRTIQDELSTPSADEKTGLAGPKLSLQTTRELKSAVDSLRLFLWAYLDTWSGNLSAQQKLQFIRIQAVAEMLSHLQQDFRNGNIPRTPETQHLCRQILAVGELIQAGLAGPTRASN